MRKLFLFVVASFVFSVCLFLGFSKADYSDLKSLSVGFCTWSSADVIVSPWEKKDLCFYFANISPKDIKVQMKLIAWGLTVEWSRNCSLVEGGDDPFAKLFILDNSGSNIVVNVPANSFTTKSFPMSIPAWVKWQQYGCMTYQSIEPEVQQVWSFFNVVYRDAIYLSLLVLDKQWAYKSSISQSFSMSINASWELFVSAKFTNEADFDETVIFTGVVSNILWYQKEFTNNFVLRTSETKNITLNLGKVPSYKWLFDLDVNWTYQAYFNGMTVDMEQFKKPISFSDSASLFEFSSTLLIAVASILFLLVLVIFALFRKRKIVYVQA